MAVASTANATKTWSTWYRAPMRPPSENARPLYGQEGVTDP